MSRFDGVVILSPAEDDNTEESEEEDDGDCDGGEEEKMTIVQTNIVQHCDDQVSSLICRGTGRTEGGLKVTVALLLRRYLGVGGGGGGGGGLRRLCD